MNAERTQLIAEYLETARKNEQVMFKIDEARLAIDALINALALLIIEVAEQEKMR
jgi:hypothetical protein